jgi:vitellogenic carboxypeptidase-like protein
MGKIGYEFVAPSIYNNKPMKQVIYLFLLVCLCHTFVTVEEQPTNNKTVLPKLNISTKCNAIDLSSYNYTGIAKSGYLSVGKGNSALTFIFYGRSGVTNPGDLNNYPTLIWLNGGPGESSQWGNFNEMGPLTVRRKLVGTGLEVVVNKNSWNREYNLLFIDQPVGTGLSYADPDFKNVFPTTTARIIAQ